MPSMFRSFDRMALHRYDSGLRNIRIECLNAFIYIHHHSSKGEMV